MADSGLSKFNQHLKIDFKKGLKQIFFLIFIPNIYKNLQFGCIRNEIFIDDWNHNGQINQR